MRPLETIGQANKRLDVQLFQRAEDIPLALRGSKITPRGIVLHCTPDQVCSIHAMGEDQQIKYESMLLGITLNFGSGEVVALSTEAQVQSIRRISQKEYQIEMCFQSMVQDGYRQISRYMADDQQAQNA